MSTAELYGGPQDGAKVTIGGQQDLPSVLYVGSKWLGDGYSAWSYAWSERKPAKYIAIPGRDGIVRYAFVSFKE